MLNEKLKEENEKRIRSFLDDVAVVLFYDRIKAPEAQERTPERGYLVLGSIPRRYGKVAVY